MTVRLTDHKTAGWRSCQPQHRAGRDTETGNRTRFKGLVIDDREGRATKLEGGDGNTMRGWRGVKSYPYKNRESGKSFSHTEAGHPSSGYAEIGGGGSNNFHLYEKGSMECVSRDRGEGVSNLNSWSFSSIL